MDEIKKKQYQNKVSEDTPTKNFWLQLIKAFVVGGLICTLGQWILNYAGNKGLSPEEASSWCALVLIFLSVALTGCNLYPRLAKFAGAGALVPITGFANSVSAAAIEFKKEGQVFGIGSKIFTIAGPVILYGIVSSWLLGLIYYLFHL